MSLSPSKRLSPELHAELSESLLPTDDKITDTRELKPDNIQLEQKAYQMTAAEESQSKLRRFETSERQTTQVGCHHWRPSLSAHCVISCTFIFCVLCLIIGIVTTIDAQGIIVSEVVEYDYYAGKDNSSSKGSVCMMENPTDKACVGEKNDRLMSVSDCALEWDGFDSNIDEHDWGKECEFYIKITEDIPKPVYLYYQVDHFFQNHRAYVKSRSFKMEKGDIETEQAADCDPLRDTNAVGQQYVLGKDAEGKDITKGLVPCGIAAYSTFNDRFQASVIRTEATEAITDATEIPCENMYKESYQKMTKDEELAEEWKSDSYKCYKICCEDDEITTYPFPKHTGPNPPAKDADGMKEVLTQMFATDNREAGADLWSKKNIAWASDVNEKYIYSSWDAAKYTNEGILQVAQTTKGIEQCKKNCAPGGSNCPFSDTANDKQSMCSEQLKVTLPRVDDQDYIVWMRYATTQDFSKLHRVLNFDLKKGDYVKIKAFNYFQLPKYGRKKLFFSTAGQIGGSGGALGVLWIVDGVICAIIAIIFLFAHKYQTKQIEKLIDGILHKAQKAVL